MARLHNKMGLKECVLSKLYENKIFTVLDFINENSEKLSSISSLSFKEVLEIRKNLISNYSSLPLSGSLSYENLLSNCALIPTGISSLDAMLRGGFLTGTVLEVCGVSGEGKTQLCLSVSAHIAACLKQAVYYLDTKGDFPASRVSEIMRHKGISEEEYKAALERVTVMRIDNLYDLVQYLHHLEATLRGQDSSPPRVVVVDSVPALYLPFMTSEGFGLLNHVMAMMKALATEHHILFIVVNLASTFVETEVREGEGEEEPGVSDVRPMLGKYWLHAPNTRLLVSRLNNEAPQRLVRVIKSTYLPLGTSCVVSVSQRGLV